MRRRVVFKHVPGPLHRKFTIHINELRAGTGGRPRPRHRPLVAILCRALTNGAAGRSLICGRTAIGLSTGVLSP